MGPIFFTKVVASNFQNMALQRVVMVICHWVDFGCMRLFSWFSVAVMQKIAKQVQGLGVKATIVCEAHFHQAHKLCVIGAFPSQIFSNVW